MSVKRLKPSLRLKLWRLLHPRKWKRQQEVFQNIDEICRYKVPGLDDVLRQGSAGIYKEDGNEYT